MTPYKTPLDDAMDYADFKKRRQRVQLFEDLRKWHLHKWDPPGTPWHHKRAYHQFHEWRMEWWRQLEIHFPDFIKGGVVCRSFLSEISELALNASQRSSAPPT